MPKNYQPLALALRQGHIDLQTCHATVYCAIDKQMKNLLPGINIAALLAGRKKWAVIAVALFVAVIIARIGFFVGLPHGAGQVVNIVDFAKGSSLRKLADELEKGGVLGSSRLFVLYARSKGVTDRVKAGTYQFSDGETPAEILRKLVAGEVYEKRFSVPEGYSIYQIAELLEGKQLFGKEAFLKECRNQDLLKELGIHAKSVEGYLFPSTYNLLNVETPAAFIKLMAEQFSKVYNERFAGLESRSGLSRSQIITLASMVEKEAVVPEEKPLIASVFFNRLKKGMPLQSDPTAVYGIRTFGGNVSKSDVQRKTDYNTYLIRGLPPGPIGNPATGAIEAVFSPAVTGYYYFVARKDGTHCFSATLGEHNRAVNFYLKGKGSR